jgi:hypothetical protein
MTAETQRLSRRHAAKILEVLERYPSPPADLRDAIRGAFRWLADDAAEEFATPLDAACAASRKICRDFAGRVGDAFLRRMAQEFRWWAKDVDEAENARRLVVAAVSDVEKQWESDKQTEGGEREARN